MNRLLKSAGIITIVVFGLYIWADSRIESTSSYDGTFQIVHVVNNNITVKYDNGDLTTFYIYRPKLTYQLNKDIKYNITIITYTSGEVTYHTNINSMLSR